LVHVPGAVGTDRDIIYDVATVCIYSQILVSIHFVVLGREVKLRSLFRGWDENSEEKGYGTSRTAIWRAEAKASLSCRTARGVNCFRGVLACHWGFSGATWAREPEGPTAIVCCAFLKNLGGKGSTVCLTGNQKCGEKEDGEKSGRCHRVGKHVRFSQRNQLIARGMKYEGELNWCQRLYHIWRTGNHN
jgi:hypothetical protein